MIGSGEPSSLDEFADALILLRQEHGMLSYGEIARRVGIARRLTDPCVPTPARSTVFDCFQRGRQRMNCALVGEIAAAITGRPQDAETWRRRCADAIVNGRAAPPPIRASDRLPTSPSTPPRADRTPSLN